MKCEELQSGFCAICVGRFLYICIIGFSQDLQGKVWQIQSTLFIFVSMVIYGLRMTAKNHINYGKKNYYYLACITRRWAM